MSAAVEAHLAAGFDAALDDLKAFCRLPSVSTDAAYAEGIAAAAGFVAERLRRAGFAAVEIAETGGHPAVYGEIAGPPEAPTVLVYGHYDVQPPDPLAKWTTPPFEPALRDGRLFARGASDDKGPVLIPILVAEAFLRREGRLPVTLKILVEGEEENGSPHLDGLVERLRDKLASDLVLSADGAMWRPDRPSLTVASRGLVALEATVSGAAKDLHSGRHGGSAPNPIRALVALLATLHDAQGRVAVAGFDDGVRPPDPLILDAIDAAAFDASGYFREIGAPAPDPMPSGRDLLVRQWLEPTLEFNGIAGGYAGDGTKTVIPALASVKITCRLVPGQTPDGAAAAIERHLRERLLPGFGLAVTRHGAGSEASAVDRGLPALAQAEAVLADLLGAAPLRVAMGATVLVGAVFKRHLDAETVFFSFSTADEDYHAPNEFFRLESFRLGQIAWARLLERLGAPAAGAA